MVGKQAMNMKGMTPQMLASQQMLAVLNQQGLSVSGVKGLNNLMSNNMMAGAGGKSGSVTIQVSFLWYSFMIQSCEMLIQLFEYSPLRYWLSPMTVMIQSWEISNKSIRSFSYDSFLWDTDTVVWYSWGQVLCDFDTIVWRTEVKFCGLLMQLYAKVRSTLIWYWYSWMKSYVILMQLYDSVMSSLV